jgi:hypothetical protein
MFLHVENQKLLWQTLQKTPYLVEFTQKFMGHREEWYRGILEQFFTQWISQGGRVPTNARELLEINKMALQFMVADLKRLMGYSSSPPIPVSSQLTQNQIDIRPYDVAAERKQREDAFSENFSKYQSEYNRLLERPELPARILPAESGGEKIKNMEELVKEQSRLREMDFEKFLPPLPKQPNSAPKLRIMGEIDNMEMTIEEPKRTVRFSNEFTNEISSNS